MNPMAHSLVNRLLLVIGTAALVLLTVVARAGEEIVSEGQDQNEATAVEANAAAAGTQTPTTVYRKVNTNGTVTFSDHKSDGAEPVEVLPANTVPPQEIKPHGSSEGSANAKEAYTACTIVSPLKDEVMDVDVSSVTVVAQVEPTLFSGHNVQFLSNGKPVGALGAALDFTMSELERGTYTMTFVVTDAKGNVACTADPVSFTVKRPSVLFPHAGMPPKGGAGSVGGSGSTGGSGTTGGAGAPARPTPLPAKK